MMKYIDMHCDTLAEALVRKQKTVRKLKGTMVDVERLQRGEAVAQFFAMFLPQRNEPSWFGCETMPDLSVLMEKMYEVYRNTLTECSDILAPAYNSKDLESYLNYEIKKLIDYGKINISSIEQCGFFKSDI